MLWVKAEGGFLLNLAHCVSITTTPEGELEAWPERAKADVTSERFILAKFPKEQDAIDALNDLYDWIRDDKVGCDFTKISA